MAKNARDHEERPWGSFTVLAEMSDQGNSSDVIIKRIEVLPGKRLSYQTHELRAEHWYTVAGEGKAIIDDFTIELTTGNSVTISPGQKHRLDNSNGTSSLIIIEIITGSFDEYDIVRIEDDFNRSSDWKN